MIFHDVDQNSDEWFGLRCGKLTSSNMSTVMANYGKAFGAPAQQLAVRIALETVTGVPYSNGYTNADMERGHIEEPIARLLYESERFVTVKNGGFFEDGFLGSSPDGLVDDDGLVEIKSAIPHIHFARVKRNAMDPTYRWQCVSQLMVTGRGWLDFISYCSDFPEDRRLFVHRMLASDYQDEFAMVTQRTAEFQGLVNDSIKIIKG